MQAATQFITVEVKVDLTKERLFSVSLSLDCEYHNKVFVKVHSPPWFILQSLFFELLAEIAYNDTTVCLPFTWANQSVHGLGKWYAKFRTGEFRPGIVRVYHLYKSVPFTEKRPRRSETGIKDGLEEMEHEFPLENFVQNKHDYLFQMFLMFLL